MPPHHRRGLFLHEGARALHRAPRGADRPLHPLWADDDVHHPVVASPATRPRTALLTPPERPHSGHPGRVKPPLSIACSSAEGASIAASAIADPTREHNMPEERRL